MFKIIIRQNDNVNTDIEYQYNNYSDILTQLQVILTEVNFEITRMQKSYEIFILQDEYNEDTSEISYVVIKKLELKSN